jgi:brefeldin A-inhibited guanine nucleotide-exchange protein
MPYKQKFSPDKLVPLFCRLSEKNVDSSDPKSYNMQSVILALDMILLIVQNINVQLPEKHSFIFVIRMYLCKALTKNAASPVISVFEKAMAIFVQLTNKFKIYLKSHIEVNLIILM